MLKKTRVILSVVLFSLITFYFLDFAGILPQQFHALTHIQFVPALLALNLGILAFLVLLTLLFGRIYCSTICPMGIFQDIVDWISKRTAKKKKKYTYGKPKTILRWSVLIATAVLYLFGITALLGLLDPYAAYGRMATHLFKPVYLAGNNLLSFIFTSFGNYTFYIVDIFIFSIFSLIISVVTFLVIGFLAWKYGRTFCNTICPVGTVLGVLSRFSFFKIRINSGKCTSCGVCATKCKASCMDTKEKTVDNSRCVDCFNCVDSCRFGALSYSSPGKATVNAETITVDGSKRKFLLAGVTAAMTTPTLLAKEKTGFLNGGKSYTRQTPISPPGALSTDRLQSHCTSCHLCISKCPTNVLKPAFAEYGFGGVMQPTMFFEKGFCNFDCTICSNVCPNHALKPLSIEEKHKTQMGHVVFIEEICIVPTRHQSCGACAEHCPTQAVKMIPYQDGLTIPTINTDICVGCGACEFICPVRPHRAIFVEGNEVHVEAKPFITETKKEIEIDDFGF
jgi:ferredoxin